MKVEIDNTTKLKMWRKTHGLTQQELADLTGLSQGYVSHLEAGERTLPPLERVRFARAVGASVRDLFESPTLEKSE
jgi:transcriptional regulator with XRE-family HTH domain